MIEKQRAGTGDAGPQVLVGAKKEHAPNSAPPITNQVTIVIGGRPTAKGRPRMTRRGIRPATRPDADNHVKAALDAVNVIVVSDDSLVADLIVSKKYATVPQLTIVITPLAALTAQGRSA